MQNLPRSRALVRLDGPGHIMPVDPVTPEASTVWRVVHLPLMLALIAVGMLFVAVLTLHLLGIGFRSLPHVPGSRYVAPVIGAVAIGAFYCLFVRVVERRPAVDELGEPGSLAEFGIGFGGGVAWSAVTFLVLMLLGGVRVIGLDPLLPMLVPFLIQLCTAAILVIVLCGLGFRLIERALGSWVAVALFVAIFGLVRYLGDPDTPAAVVAVALEAGLLFAAVFMVTRRLWASIGVGAGWKMAQGAFYGGVMTADGPHGLVASYLVGPVWLTGGQAGADTSAPAIAISALLLAALLIAAKYRGRVVRPFWQRGRFTRPVAVDRG